MSAAKELVPVHVQQFNVMIVDDDGAVLRVVESEVQNTHDAIKGVLIGGVQKFQNPDEALKELQRIQRECAQNIRGQVHLVISDVHMPDEATGLAFLRQVRELNEPYVVAYSSHPSSEAIEGVCHQYVRKDAEVPLTDSIKTLLSANGACQKHWGNIAERKQAYWKESSEISVEIFEPAPCGPLHAIHYPVFDPANDNCNILEDEKLGRTWTAMLDFDDTLYQANDEHSIILHQFAEFLRDEKLEEFTVAGGDSEVLNQLIQYCDDWRKERGKISAGMQIYKKFHYEKSLQTADDMSALAFKGMLLSKLQEFSKEFAEKHLNKGILPHAPLTTKKIRDHGLVSVLTTGAPDFMVPYILPALEHVNHGVGTKYMTDDQGKLTGTIGVHMGLAEEKARYGNTLTRAGKPVVLAIGNSVGDQGMCGCAVRRSLYKHDVNGVFILINGSEEAITELERAYTNEIDGERVYIVPKTKPDKRTQEMMKGLDKVLETLFQPTALYARLKRGERILINEEEVDLKRYLEILKEELNEDSDDKDEECDTEGSTGAKNLENIKRIRDLLVWHGLTETDIHRLLCKYYPEILVDAAMKPDIIKSRIPQNVDSWLERIGAYETEDGRQAARIIMDLNTDYHRRRGTLISPRMKKSTIPPSAPDQPDSEPSPPSELRRPFKT